MATKIRNLTYISGDDNALVLEFPDNRSISDYDIFFTVKPYNSTTTDDSDALLTVNSTDCTFDTENNKIIVPTNYSTIRLDEGVYKYDLQLKNKNTGEIYTILIGKYKIINDVTKRTS